jgi:hypothetical protein
MLQGSALKIKQSATGHERGCDPGRNQHRDRLGNDDEDTGATTHFLRILSKTLPLASSSTNLFRPAILETVWQLLRDIRWNRGID